MGMTRDIIRVHGHEYDLNDPHCQWDLIPDEINDIEAVIKNIGGKALQVWERAMAKGWTFTGEALSFADGKLIDVRLLDRHRHGHLLRISSNGECVFV